MARSSKSKDDKPIDPRETAVVQHSQTLADDAKENAKHIHYISFGSDKNKIKKNSVACDRGTSSGPARYCSSHLRSIYPQNILGDNNKTEWCVEGRHNKQCCKFKNNSCRLCNIDGSNYIKLPMTKFAEALREELGFKGNNKDRERYNRALQSFLTSHIISDYPGTKKENTILRIKRNGKIWMEYFIKLTAFSSLLKTSAPSGYKYKDRISIGGKIKIQNNVKRDLIFCIEKDASYNDPEKEQERPVVNGVGFWNLLKEAKQDEIRNIIQLNIDQAVNVCFGFLMKKDHNIQKIEVELECTRHGLGLNEKPITLWCWPSNNNDDNSMSSIDIDEQKSNTNGSPTISTQSISSAPSTSPMSRYDHYPSFDPLNTMPIPPLPPQLPLLPQIPIQPRIPQRMNNYNHSYNYGNHYQHHYGAYRGTNYINYRHEPYHRPQNTIPMLPRNLIEFEPQQFDNQYNNDYDIIQDQYIADDVLTSDNFVSFPDNERLFVMNEMNINNEQYFDIASMS